MQVPGACEDAAPVGRGQNPPVAGIGERKSAPQPTSLVQAELPPTYQVNVYAFAEPPAAVLAPGAPVQLQDIEVRPATGRERFEHHDSPAPSAFFVSAKCLLDSQAPSPGERRVSHHMNFHHHGTMIMGRFRATACKTFWANFP